MKKLIIILSLPVLLLLFGCSDSDTERSGTGGIITTAGNTADFPQMTSDPGKEIVVAWWIEKEKKTGQFIVYFSTSPSDQLNFAESRAIPTSKRVTPGNGENLPKLIVKPDGTYLLVFSRRNRNSDAPFASSVLYTQSFDAGTTWTDPVPVHSDLNPDNGHGFPEAVILPDGEVGAAWLDGRNNLDHSEVFFAKTDGKYGFTEDRQIGGPGCQCCKLDMYVDNEKNVHLTYRNLTEDNIRDIVYLKSDNSGSQFTAPKQISLDNWQIKACPHNGPSVSKENGKLHFLWYTQGGSEGLYYSRSVDNGNTFTQRIKLAEKGKRPYITALNQSTLAVWDEAFKENERIYRRVKLARITGGSSISKSYLSPPGIEASMPYLLKTGPQKAIIIWTQRSETGNKIHFEKLTDRERKPLLSLIF